MTAIARQPKTVSWAWQPQRLGSTPAWLRVVTATLVALAAFTGFWAGLTVLSRSHAVKAARTIAEPLVVDAQTAVVKLSDANTTVAGGFLAGPVIPAAAQVRFRDDLAQASVSLTAAAQRAGTDGQISEYLQAAATDLPIYSGLIATAETDNRQGQPVGAAYLAEANHFMNAALLPAAYLLYSAEQARLVHDSGRATKTVRVVVAIILLCALLLTLLYLQGGLVRRFHRLLNPGCLIATVASLALTIWLIVGAASEGAAVSRAEQQGANPLNVLTQARILASQARADDELTLVTRDSDSTYQRDYASVAGRLRQLIDQTPGRWTNAETHANAGAASAWSAYTRDHQTVRADDASGRLAAAVGDDRLRSSPSAATMDSVLAGGVAAAVESFDKSAGAAESDLTGLFWGSGLLMVIVIISVLAGTRPRLREYR